MASLNQPFASQGKLKLSDSLQANIANGEQIIQCGLLELDDQSTPYTDIKWFPCRLDSGFVGEMIGLHINRQQLLELTNYGSTGNATSNPTDYSHPGSDEPAKGNTFSGRMYFEIGDEVVGPVKFYNELLCVEHRADRLPLLGANALGRAGLLVVSDYRNRRFSVTRAAALMLIGEYLHKNNWVPNREDINRCLAMQHQSLNDQSLDWHALIQAVLARLGLRADFQLIHRLTREVATDFGATVNDETIIQLGQLLLDNHLIDKQSLRTANLNYQTLFQPSNYSQFASTQDLAKLQAILDNIQ